MTARKLERVGGERGGGEWKREEESGEEEGEEESGGGSGEEREAGIGRRHDGRRSDGKHQGRGVKKGRRGGCSLSVSHTG